ncbi:MAG: hypothetical protein IPL93_11385 [Actinomycetales bacterium]|nr:hypothetical protein [Actinomycetales bacterium]
MTIVVINQPNRLTPDAVESCRADLTRLLAADGLGAAKVMRHLGSHRRGGR